MTDSQTVDKSSDDDKPSRSKVLTRKGDNGADIPVVDFASYAEAIDQAKAIGKGASVEAIGTAYHVRTGD